MTDDLPTSARTFSHEETKVSSAMDDEEFNLHQSYHNAIDCLRHSDRIIRNLQEELASKDEHILSLEEKLVRMSFELASAKALEDEHQLLKRRMAILSNSITSSEHSHPQTDETDEGLPRKNRPRVRPQPRPAARRSSSEVAVTSNSPSVPQGKHARWQIVPEAAAAVPIKRARGFSLSRVMSCRWVADDNRLDASLNDSTKDNMNFSGATSDKFSRASRFENSPANSDMNRTMRGTSLTEFQTRRLSTKPTFVSLDGDSFTPRRMSNIGQYFGLKKNDNSEMNAVRETNDEVDIGGRSEPRRQRRESVSSSRSSISGVVFPVSSNDCLMGCQDDFESRRRRCSTANEEWPTFG
eukprot:CAMPEP_0201880686 /NCGR_PEP_ID=MMETSP0902-20130614/11201_1 /ASSEMBLY_ACC=CAM_ASM_000551 /TAXON_ID=420261 /ORGANISM="Thalassiosira antarctica, Strain CCMP982" /LENGTH=353 /DNA_ID=CAMNT_0048408737 /DNA_START=186 /DNA_END=1247 /DNA_ORIENTATION=+